ncbi:MAG: TetR/AcrR family transcriptional regulator [Deinococcota bacterium]
MSNLFKLVEVSAKLCSVTVKKPQNRQERRKAQTRKRLLDATQTLVLEKGVDALTVNDIIEKADVGRGTFYVYFETKEEAVWNLLSAMFREIEDHLSQQLDTGDEARLAKWRFIFQTITTHQDLVSTLIGQNGHISTRIRMENYIAEIMIEDLEKGTLTPKQDIALPLLSRYLAGALTSMIAHWLEQPKTLNVDDIATSFFLLANNQFESS